LFFALFAPSNFHFFQVARYISMKIHIHQKIAEKQWMKKIKTVSS